MAHSPAPWNIVRASEYTDDPEDTKIMSITAADGTVVLYTDSGYYKPKEDDAALIHAAPGLLKACERMLDYAMMPANEANFLKSDIVMLREIVDKAKTAPLVSNG